MSDSTSLLDQISSTQAQKEVTANALFDAASPATLWGRHASATSGLVWGYYGGNYQVGGTANAVANGTVTLTASTTNYIYASATTGAVSVNTTGFPAGSIPLYQVVTGSSTITSWSDKRCYQPSAVSGGGGSGTVTSVGLTAPSQFTVTGSPVTTSGTLGLTWANQNANLVLAGPTTGAAAAPTFRSLVGADIPVFGPSGTGHAPGGVPDPGATTGTTRYLREDGTWAVPAGGGGGSGTVTSVAASGGVETDQGGAITASGTIREAMYLAGGAIQTAAYTFVTGDRGKTLVTNSSSAVSQALPTPTSGVTSNFPAGWLVNIENIGTGTVTVAPPTGTKLDGVTNGTLALAQNTGATFFTDGTDYYSIRGAATGGGGSPGAAPNIVQKASNTANNSPCTVTLSSAPTPGNMLVAVIGGHVSSTGALTPAYASTDGWGTACWIQNPNNGIAILVKPVVSGDGTSWTFTMESNITVALYEVSGAGMALGYASIGKVPGSSTASSTGAGAGLPCQNTLVITGFENDAGAAYASAVSSGWTIDVGGSAGPMANHATVSVSGKPSSGGALTPPVITWNGSSTSQAVVSATVVLAPANLGASGGSSGSSSEIRNAIVLNGYYSILNPSVVGPNVTTANPATGSIYFLPIVVHRPMTIKPSLYVTTSDAGSTWKVGIWAQDSTTGMPGALLKQFGNINTAATGLQQSSDTYDIQPGTYWMGVSPSSGNVTVRALSLASGTGYGIPGLLGFPSSVLSSGNTTYGGLLASWTYGTTLPAGGSLTFSDTTTSYKVFFQVTNQL